MRYDTIIFDLDGVICHTDRYHYQAWKMLADKLHIYFDETINNRLRGVSRMESLDIILEKSEKTYSREEKQLLSEEKNDCYKELLKQMSPADLSAEVSETLKELRKRGFTLTIGSSSKNTRFILNQIGLGSFFDAISDGNNITNSKPDPEVFLKACEYAGSTPERCLVIEDAEAGIQAALAGGMHCAAIGDAVKCEKATYKLDSFSQLLEIAGNGEQKQ